MTCVLRPTTTESCFMIKAVVPAFILAVTIIISASAFAPRSNMIGDEGCDLAYGIEGCSKTSLH